MTWPNIDTFSFALGVFSMVFINLLEAFVRGFMRSAKTRSENEIELNMHIDGQRVLQTAIDVAKTQGWHI